MQTHVKALVRLKMMVIWFGFLLICGFGDAARILVFFSAPFISHQMTFRPLTEELARIGHEVTVITTDPAFNNDNRPANLTEIDVHDISYNHKYKFCNAVSARNTDVYIQAFTYYRILSEIFEEQIQDEKVQKVFQNKFDLVITEACIRPAVVLSHVLKAPLISASSLGSIDSYTSHLGSTAHPTLYPGLFQQRIRNMTLLEKAYEVFKHYLFNLVISYQEGFDNDIIKRNFGKDVPSLNDLKKNVELLLINVHHFWEGNRPVPPNIVYLGGLHLNSVAIRNQVIDEDLQKYLDSSKNGVIYVSYGSNIELSLFPQSKTGILLKVLSQLPYNVLLKWDQDRLPKNYDNIKILKWTPQAKLLKHPKIKLFITQGGLQSTDEAIDAGVPLVVMPLLGDQWYNAEQYRHFNIGIRVDFDGLTEDQLFKAVNTVLGDESYRKNVEKLRSLIHDQPQTALDRAVWWTEHVLRHGGGKHLRAAGAGLTWTEYLELNLVFVIFSALSVVFFVVWKFLKFLFRCFVGYRKLKTM